MNIEYSITSVTYAPHTRTHTHTYTHTHTHVHTHVQPAPLSSGSTATREDLLKDREAAAERVKQFLTANNETPTTNTASTDPKPNTISLTTSLDGVKTTDQTDGGKNPVSATKSDVTTTSNSVQTGLKLSSALVGKMVSFANPITSGMPSTTTTISTSGGLILSMASVCVCVCVSIGFACTCICSTVFTIIYHIQVCIDIALFFDLRSCDM